MINKALDRSTVFELLQTQLTHYLMVEKYGFRAEKYAQSPQYISISKSEIKALENVVRTIFLPELFSSFLVDLS